MTTFRVVSLGALCALALANLGAGGGGCGLPAPTTDGGSSGDEPDMALPAPSEAALRCGEARACIASIAPGDTASEANCLKKLNPPAGPALTQGEINTQVGYMNSAQGCERPVCQAENMSALDPCDDDPLNPGQFKDYLNCLRCMSKLEAAGRCATESAQCPLPVRYR